MNRYLTNHTYALVGASAFLMAALAASTARADTVNYDDTITAIYGAGNPSNGWSADTSTNGDITVALRADSRSTGAVSSDDAGDYTYDEGSAYDPSLGESLALWDVQFSIYDSSGITNPNVQFLWTVDTDPTAAVDVASAITNPFNPLAISDDSYGTASTANGGGGAYQSGDTVAQNSENLVFAGGNPNIPGIYTYTLEAVNTSTGNALAQIKINVDVQVPDGGNTLLLAAGALALVLALPMRRFARAL